MRAKTSSTLVLSTKLKIPIRLGDKLQGRSVQNMYKQCTLQKGTVFHKAWIPSVFAVKGKQIRIDGKVVQFGSQWKVISVGDTELDESYVRELERDYLHQRKASDI